MSSHEEDDDSTIPLEFVVLGGLQRAIGWLFAFVLAFVTWAIVTVWLTYVALTAPDGSFLQSLASELAATICLFGIAPVLFNFWRIEKGSVLVASLAGAVALVAASWFLPNGPQSLLMDLGCGIALLLVLDYWIHGAWTRALDESARKTADENARKTVVV